MTIDEILEAQREAIADLTASVKRFGELLDRMDERAEKRAEKYADVIKSLAYELNGIES